MLRTDFSCLRGYCTFFWVYLNIFKLCFRGVLGKWAVKACRIILWGRALLELVIFNPVGFYYCIFSTFFFLQRGEEMSSYHFFFLADAWCVEHSKYILPWVVLFTSKWMWRKYLTEVLNSSSFSGQPTSFFQWHLSNVRGNSRTADALIIPNLVQ